MDSGAIPLLSLLKDRMEWLSRRQDVLSQNVASANVPGFRARDLRPMDFDAALKNAMAPADALMVTDPHHIAPSRPDAGIEDVDAPDQSSPDGNSVSLESEMIKVADTQAQYEAAANLYAKAIDMMKIAIGRSGS